TYIGLAIGETSFRPAPAERHESSALRSQRSARRSGGAYKRISRNGRRDFLARARTELLADDAVRDLQEFLLGPRWDRGPRRRVVAASASTDGLAGLRDRVHRFHQIFPVAAQEPQGLSQELLAVAAANAVADLRLVVAAAGIHERPELLRVPRRASRGFPDQGVRLAGEPFRFLRT